jgi:ABC-type lipoprotein release transport system permease subunit
VFEFQIIKRYLIPNKKHLSNSFISTISIFTIALTVWLLIVFLSILKGVESSWIHKLTTLQAPIRLVPNQHYFNSPYFNKISDEDDFFQYETLFEKARHQEKSDGSDFVYQLKKSLNNRLLTYDIYEVTGGILKIQISKTTEGRQYESTLTQASYLTNPPINSLNFLKIVKPLDEDDKDGLKKLGSIEELSIKTLNNKLIFPPVYQGLEPVLIPKNYKDAGVKAGDRLELSFSQAFSFTGNPPTLYGYVAGFYDPGMMSVGTRVCFLRTELIEQLVAPEQASSLDPLLKGGFFVYLKDVKETKKIAEELKKEPFAIYFDVIPYYEFPFAKEIIGQFQADQILFSLIGLVILTIASLNIVAALILIVQEKKHEIGLFIALGATHRQIQKIFASLGFIIGFMGFLIGTILSIITLYNLEWIVNKILFLKGHPAIKALNIESGNPLISYEILAIVLIITPLLAMFAGMIPARKALKIQPIEILKNG